MGIAAGSIQSAHCPGEGGTTLNSFAYRRCLAGVPAEWGSVDASECESVAGRAVREKVEQSNVIYIIMFSTHNVVINCNN